MTVDNERVTRALERIREVVGPRGIVDAEVAAERHLIDHLRRYRGIAPVVLPASTDEVAHVVRIAADARLGIVPQGGNTGYCGGATPDASGEQIVLGTARLNAIREVDAVNFTLTAEAGVILAEVQRAAADHDLLFPLSLGAEGSCQIGGNLSTNAGGIAVLRYGNARDLVLGLEVVLADGSVWHGLSKLRKNNAGYDLRHLFLGAEGTLGVITAAVLKLFPRPRQRETALVAVRDAEAACALLARARRESGDMVTSFEYFPRYALELVLEHIPGSVDPLGEPQTHYVLVELSSAAPGAALAAQLEHVLAAGLEQHEAIDAVIAQSEAQRSALWRLRENIPEAQRLSGGSYKHDVSVPISELPALLRRGSEAALAMCPGLGVCAYGHLGDGNLHFNFHPPAGMSLAAFTERHGEALSARLHGLVEQSGGSVCAEHGVGQSKSALLARHADPVALALMRRLKATLDPMGLMNPGKVLSDSAGRGSP